MVTDASWFPVSPWSLLRIIIQAVARIASVIQRRAPLPPRTGIASVNINRVARTARLDKSVGYVQQYDLNRLS